MKLQKGSLTLPPLSQDSENTKRFLIVKKTETGAFQTVSDQNTPLTRSEAENMMCRLAKEDASIAYVMLPMVLDVDGSGLDFP